MNRGKNTDKDNLDAAMYLTESDMGSAAGHNPRGTRPFDHAGPRIADEGDDSLGRQYADLEPLGGPDIVEDVARAPQYTQENFATDTGGKLVRPLSQYELPVEGLEPGTRPVRVGPWVMANPGVSGIAEPLDFKKPEPTVTLKRASFGDLILGPREGEASNFYDAKSVKKSAPKELGDGLFSDIVGEDEGGEA